MKLVIADDHRIVREGLRWMLSNEPEIEIVGEAENGQDLLDLLGHTATDIVLLDVRMPGMSGFEALSRVRSLVPEVRVIILSMHDEPAYVKEAVELGASGYLLKSTDRDELIRALHEVALGRPYVQGEITGPLLRELADPAGPGTVPRLNDRELEVLRLVAQGLKNKQVAHELGLSEETVKTQLKSVFARLEVKSRSEAVAVGLRSGLIE